MKRILSALGACLAAILAVGQPTPAPSSVNHPEWSRNAVIYEVNTRQFTTDGTFNSLRQQLPRLNQLGVDILWLMPIHPISKANRKGVLGSYYAVADYKAVNPEFGSMEDFRALVDEAHNYGMKVILDWVPNHTGCDHIWTWQHPEFYARDEKGNFISPYDWTDTYKLDYNRFDLREAMADAMKFWILAAEVDGFRCDVAGEVPTNFWDWLRPQLEDAAGKPIFMLAEAAEPDLLKKGFDMDYNWPMKDLFSAIAYTSGQYRHNDDKVFEEKHAKDITRLLVEQARQFPADSYMMNMTSNHDLNSWEGT